MVKKIFYNFLTIIISMCFMNISSANELKKLIDLFDKEIITSEVLYNSVLNLNKNITEDQLIQMIDLLNSKTISSEDFIKSFNVMSVDNQSNVSQDSNEIIDIIKKFKISDCKGHTTTCSIIDGFFIEYKYTNNSLVMVSNNFLSKSDLVKITPRKQYYKKNNFSEIFDFKLKSGRVVQFALKGLIENNDFSINPFSLSNSGQQIISGNFN
ncbi:MAG: hypothetical protein O3C61_01480 [Proteobacteria bacterium]|nr:hypothetical protein [Pseudomonadota bacterium]